MNTFAMLFIQGERMTQSPKDTTTCCNLSQIVENFQVARLASNHFVKLSNFPIERKIESREKPNMFSVFSAIGEPVRLEWFNPQGEHIVTSRRMSLHTESSRSRLIIYNAIVEDAGIYRCQATDASGHTEEASVVLEIYRKSGCPQPKDHGETSSISGQSFQLNFTYTIFGLSYICVIYTFFKYCFPDIWTCVQIVVGP